MLSAYRIRDGDAIGVASRASAGYAAGMETCSGRYTWWAALGLFCLLGCFSPPTRPPDPIHLNSDSEAMRREVLKHIPYGMPLKQGREIMEANGFTCKNDRRNRVLICNITPLTSRPIRVWLHYDPENTVKDVQARCDHIAPDNE
jgi:hypothetical protein